MLDLPDVPKGFNPRGNLKTIPGEVDVPGPFVRNKKPAPDNLSDPVKSKRDKEAKAEEVKRRLKTLSVQLYGPDIESAAEEYAEDASQHELSHATSVNKKVQFGLALKNNDVYPYVKPAEKLSPREKKRMAEAPGHANMSREDKYLYDQAQKEIKSQTRKIVIAAIAATPLCGGLIYLATQLAK